MNIRRKLNEDEYLNTDGEKYREIFLGNQFGIGLAERGPRDGHIVFEILSEDDGFWFFNGKSASSSYWIGDLQEVLVEVKKWLDENADVDIPKNESWPKDTPCGWKFRK